ncbi:uncharacterized protein [Nicotiana tomentosiformis]|uniref:uncharacterized protein n=1 Tax=Nicotiana tomentosiformis TaxID=4098 RepID=UPI00388C6388
MTSSIKRWWKDYMSTRLAGSPALTWDQFSQLFLEKFLPITLREGYHRQFESLQQGSMTVTQYENRFMDLARNALLLLHIERERAKRFIYGLTHPIRIQMAKETGGEISFQTTANIARRIEMVLAQERGHGSDKRPRHFGGFSGASSRGRDCHANTVTLALSGLPRLEWRGTSGQSINRVISYVNARCMVEKGCLAYLAYVHDSSAEVPSMDSVPVVLEFPEVFPMDLPKTPPDKDIDFRIDLAPGTQPISISPYRMTPLELMELKEQLQDLLDKVFTKPSVSP